MSVTASACGKAIDLTLVPSHRNADMENSPLWLVILIRAGKYNLLSDPDKRDLCELIELLTLATAGN